VNKKLDIQYHGLTDTGKTRTTNEDCFWCGDICDGRFVLAVVIDGCGGHRGGLQAATMTRDALLEFLDEQSHTGDTAAWLWSAMIEANNLVHRGRYDDAALEEMCCVATAIIIDRELERLYMAHVGDTRLYASHESRIIKLSHDHSPIGQQEELGYLTENDAMSHIHRNVIDRAIGHKFLLPMDKYVEIQSFPLTGGLTLMLCSDGLYDMVTSAQMSEILRQQETPAQMAAELVEAANQAGGKDNVTVIVLRTSSEETQDAARLMDIYAERMNPYKRPVPKSKDIPATQPEQQPATDSQPESGSQSESEEHPDSENRSEPDSQCGPELQPASQDESLEETPDSQQLAPVQDTQPESEPTSEPEQKPDLELISEPEPQPEQPLAKSPESSHTPECGKSSADNSQAGPQNMETPSEAQGIEPEPMPSLPFTRTEKQKRRAKAIDRIIFVAVWLVMVVFILIGFRYWQSQKQAFIRIQNQMIRQQMEIQQLQDSINQLQDSIRTLQIRFHNDTVIIQSDTKQRHPNVLPPSSGQQSEAAKKLSFIICQLSFEMKTIIL